MHQDLIMRSLVAGVISVAIALLGTVIANFIVGTTDLGWALIAVTFAAFISGFASYYAGWTRRTDVLS